MSSPEVPAAVAEYLSSIEGERGDAVRAVFETVNNAMPDGYELTDFRGAPLWQVPLSTVPKTYNGDPLSYISLMAQKNYNSLYLMGLYSDPESNEAFRAAWIDSGLKLNMGKSCLRFKTLADVNLDVLADSVSAMTLDKFLDVYERNQQRLSAPESRGR